MRWVVLAVVVWVLLVWYANRVIFQPMTFPAGDWGAQARIGAQDVGMTTSDRVHLNAWWVGAQGASLVTLYLHGNAGNITHRDTAARALVAAGSNVLLVDYRGYGKSAGRPTERGVYIDAETAYATLRSQGWTPKQIVLYGQSLGTAVAVELAVRLPVAGVVLEAPFTSARAMANEVLPLVGPLCVWGFDTRSRIGQLHAPLLIIHGQQDTIVPARMSQTLYDAAPQPKTLHWLPAAGHNDVVEAGGSEYLEALRRFYATLR